MISERWRPIPGYAGKYEASDFGRIRSLRFVNGLTDRPREFPLVLKPRPDSNGRLGVSLCRDGQVATCPIAPLILTAFVGPCPTEKDLCAHWDGDHTNNALSNLRWATYRENEADKKRHGRHLAGARNHRAILSDAEVLEIRRKLWAGHNASHLARAYGVSQTAIFEAGSHRTFAEIPDSPPPFPFKPRNKLSDDMVQEIRDLRKKGLTLRSIGARYGITDGHVCNIVNGKTRRSGKPARVLRSVK